jgi:hypothetical protein
MAAPKVILVTLVLALLILGIAGNHPSQAQQREADRKYAEEEGELWSEKFGVLLEKRGVSFIKSTNITLLPIL